MAVLSLTTTHDNGLRAQEMHRRQSITEPSTSSTSNATTYIIIPVVVVAVVGLIVVGLKNLGRRTVAPKPVVKAPQTRRHNEMNRRTTVSRARNSDAVGDWDPDLRRVFEANPQPVVEQSSSQTAGQPSQPEQSAASPLDGRKREAGERGEEDQVHASFISASSPPPVAAAQDPPQTTDEPPEGVSSPSGDGGEHTSERRRAVFFHQDAGQVVVLQENEEGPIEMPPPYESIILTAPP